MDNDTIKFLEGLSCIFPVMLCYVCYICKKTREHSPLLDLESNIESNIESNVETNIESNVESNSLNSRESFLETISEENLENLENLEK